jgi:hypothetical protein
LYSPFAKGGRDKGRGEMGQANSFSPSQGEIERDFVRGYRDEEAKIMKYVKTESELLDQLQEQIGLIIRSTTSYDEGFESEAKNLALRIRILLYDTRNSNSLLTHLNKKNIKYYDSTTPYRPNNLLPYSGLTMLKTSGTETSFVAPLDGGAPSRSKTNKLVFNTWWKGVFVIKDKAGVTFTREKLVIEVTDTDGGAHVDIRLKEEYANLSRSNSLGWQNVINGPVLPSIRQITHELLKTLKDEFPTLF